MKKNSVFKALSVAAIAGALAFAPAAANAYAPEPGTETITIEAGGTATVTIDGFAGSEPVETVLTGFNGEAATLASAVGDSSTSITKDANEAGSVDVTVTLPENAQGQYTLEATGLESGAVANGTILVPTADGPGDDDGNDDDLIATGADAAGLGLWIGGGALLLGGGAVLVARSVRKQGSQA